MNSFPFDFTLAASLTKLLAASNLARGELIMSESAFDPEKETLKASVGKNHKGLRISLREQWLGDDGAWKNSESQLLRNMGTRLTKLQQANDISYGENIAMITGTNKLHLAVANRVIKSPLGQPTFGEINTIANAPPEFTATLDISSFRLSARDEAFYRLQQRDAGPPLPPVKMSPGSLIPLIDPRATTIQEKEANDGIK